MSIVLTCAAFSLLWNVLFSPYGAEVRIIAPYYVVIFITCEAFTVRKAAPAAVSAAKRHQSQARARA